MHSLKKENILEVSKNEESRSFLIKIGLTLKLSRTNLNIF